MPSCSKLHTSSVARDSGRTGKSATGSANPVERKEQHPVEWDAPTKETGGTEHTIAVKTKTIAVKMKTIKEFCFELVHFATVNVFTFRSCLWMMN